MFIPQLWACLPSYHRKQVLSDVLAGLVVGVVALPLAMAFAIAAGVPPEKGLYTAIIAGLVASALGGSRVQISGPTGAFVVIVADIVHRHGLDGLAVCTFLAGGLVLLMGLARLGAVIRYIPYPVITGFTSGIAVIIFSCQIKDLLGLSTGPLPDGVFAKWAVYAQTLPTLNGTAVLLSGLCVLLIVVLRRHFPRVPGALLAMLLATVLVQTLHLPVETIGSRFGGIPSGLPCPELPALSLERVRELFSPALTVALLAAIESLLSATVADGMIGARHCPNTELMAQGIANLCSPLFGGIPATGAIARTATNIKNGGRTPLAGIVHALTLLGLMVAFAGWARQIPLCALASILVVVAYHMSEWRAFRALLRTPPGDVAVLLTTFGLTVAFDLTLAVQFGVVLAALLFVKRMTDLTRIGEVRAFSGNTSEDEETEELRKEGLPAGVQVYEVQGPFCFGAADKLLTMMPIFTRPPRVMVLQLEQVPVIDATGLHALTEFHKQCQGRGTQLLLAGVQPHLLSVLRRWPGVEVIGRENLCSDRDAALERARQLLQQAPVVEPGIRKEAA